MTQTRNKNLLLSSPLSAARFRGGSLPQINNNDSNFNNENNAINNKASDKVIFNE